VGRRRVAVEPVEARGVVNCPEPSAPVHSLADLKAWAARRGMTLVDRSEFEAHCATAASLTAKQADKNSDFDRFLLNL
jgi:hypothetical protein